MTESEAIISQYLKTICDLQGRVAQAAGELFKAQSENQTLKLEMEKLKNEIPTGNDYPDVVPGTGSNGKPNMSKPKRNNNLRNGAASDMRTSELLAP